MIDGELMNYKYNYVCRTEIFDFIANAIVKFISRGEETPEYVTVNVDRYLALEFDLWTQEYQTSSVIGDKIVNIEFQFLLM